MRFFLHLVGHFLPVIASGFLGSYIAKVQGPAFWYGCAGIVSIAVASGYLTYDNHKRLVRRFEQELDERIRRD